MVMRVGFVHFSEGIDKPRDRKGATTDKTIIKDNNCASLDWLTHNLLKYIFWIVLKFFNFIFILIF